MDDCKVVYQTLVFYAMILYSKTILGQGQQGLMR